MKRFFPFIILFLCVGIFFNLFFAQGKLPIPADTIVGLYHPFRDLYAAEYPRGIPFKNFLITDPVRQQYPFRELVIAVEKKGELPLWNPYNMAGTPLFATFQSAALYPLNVFFFIMPFPIAWSFLIFLQPLLAGIFLYWYLQNLKLHRMASLFGGITYTFCGFFIAWLEWGTIGHVALWLPLTLLSIDKIINSKFEARNSKQYRNSNDRNIKRFKFFDFENFNLFRISIFDIRIFWCLVFVFSLISSFFAGHLQVFFYLFLVSLVYFFARWWQFGRKGKMLLLFLILTSCFLLLTFVQWFPTLQFIQESARDIDQLDWHKEGWFLPWQHLVQFIVPDFFGNPTTLNYWGIWNYAEFVGYIGILPLLMALLALFIRRDKKTFFFGFVFLFSLIFALPTFFAKIPYVFDIPFIATAQPTRLLFLADFSLAILAGLGLDLLLRQHIKKKVFYPLLFVVGFFIALWIFVLAGQKIAPQISAENLFVTKRNLYFPSLILLSLIPILLMKAFIRNKKFDLLLVSLFIVITVFDLLRFANKFIPFVEKNYLFPSTKAMSYLQNDKEIYRIMSTQSEILPPNFSAVYRLQSLDGYDPLYLRRYGEFIAAMERSEPNIKPPFGFNRIITPHRIDSPLIDLLGVKYVLSLSEVDHPKFEKVFTEGQTKIYKNKQAFPRVFFVKTTFKAFNKQDAINKIFENKSSLNEIAIIEDAEVEDKKVWDDKVLINSNVRIKSYEENRVTIETENKKEGFLVLTDSFYPTWHAFIDRKEVKIYLTNYNFRGVIVPPGKHTVIFENRLL